LLYVIRVSPLAVGTSARIASTMPKVSGLTAIEYKRGDDFQRSYANNVQLLSSNWDLEFIFGELDQSQGPNFVSQHTSISIPWPQAKVLLYFLSMHVSGHEAEFGRTKNSDRNNSGSSGAETEGARSGTRARLEATSQQYEDFIKINPESAPKQKSAEKTQ
jgi:hypothetical protein